MDVTGESLESHRAIFFEFFLKKFTIVRSAPQDSTQPLETRETVSQFVIPAGFPFDFAQGGDSFDSTQDREPLERSVEPQISSAEADSFGMPGSVSCDIVSRGDEIFAELST